VAKHAEQERDKEEGGEDEPRLRRTVDDVQHREDRGEKLQCGEARFGEMPVQAEAEHAEEADDQRHHDRVRLEERLPIHPVLRVEHREHREIQRGKGTRHDETADPDRLHQFVPARGGSFRVRLRL
jgi:hypothetical protein